MPAIKRKFMKVDKFSMLVMKSPRFAPNAPRRTTFLLSILFLAFLLACSFGCASSSSTGDGSRRNSSASGASDLPELTDEIIRERINDAFLEEVPAENGTDEPIHWSFDESEPKEIAVVEKKIDGERATLLLDIKTRSAPGMRKPIQLAGRIRTEWLLRTGWVLRRWEIVMAENISMKYGDLPNQPAQNSNLK